MGRIWRKFRMKHMNKQIKACFVGHLDRQRNNLCKECEYQVSCRRLETRGKI